MTIEQISQSKTEWTLEEAVAQLRANPGDPYIQYFAIVLARRQNKLEQLLQMFPPNRIVNRTANLLAIFGGSAAVQECLQLDAMMPESLPELQAVANQRRARTGSIQPASRASSVAQLEGPTVASHPWTEMLNGRTVKVSRLSKMVPSDFFLIESRSPKKLLDAIAAASSWQDYVLRETQAQTHSFKLVERIQRQLMLDHEQLELLHDEGSEEVCLTGSDLYFNEGSDITFLTHADADVANRLLDSILKPANQDVLSDSFYFGKTKCVSKLNHDRSISVFAANPLPELHVRSNCRKAFERILTAIDSASQSRLGETDEFAYVRSLMPMNQHHEDVFVYFSDPFIRNLVGPRLRLTQRRRKICRGYLQMIDSAVLMYCAQERKRPSCLDELRVAECLIVDHEILKCPDGGAYELGNDALSPSRCTFHGGMQNLTPCIEIEIDEITEKESDEYVAFVQSYNQYWRTVFDPIAIRAQLHNGEYRAETIVLPLIENSVYTGLEALLRGVPIDLNTKGTHENSIFSTAAKANRDILLPAVDASRAWADHFLGVDWYQSVRRFIVEGLGDEIGFNVCDAVPTFSLDLPALMGMATAAGARSGAQITGPFWLAGVVASLQMPVYGSVRVKDVEVVDQFFSKQLPAMLMNIPSQMGSFYQYSEMDGSDGRRSWVLTFTLGPASFRLFVERIGEMLYVASQSNVLDKLWHQRSLSIESASSSSHSHCANAMMKLTPASWEQIRTDASLSWRQNNHRTCRSNLGYLTAVGRAEHSLTPNDSTGHCGLLHEAIYRDLDRCACPSHGVYSFNGSTHMVECSLHGSLTASKLPNSSTDQQIPLFQLQSVIAALTFIEEGLKAEIRVKIRPTSALGLK